MSTYARLPVTFERGEGVWLWDDKGNKYLDALSGIGVCGLGHAHPAVAEALSKQASTLVHTSNLYHIPAQTQLAEKLCALAGMDKAFFCNSGAEAIEASIKLARLYGHNKGIERPSVIVTENSFHGRTLATLSATGNRKVQAGFEPLVQGFIRVPYNDIEALKSVAKNSPDAVAILVEPIQGEGGINIPDADYLSSIRTLCDEQGWLMMLDEIQTGVGRTGRYFAAQHYNVVADVVAVAKGLGNGVPIGACLARGTAATIFQAGNHGSTFGGNPLACSAALAVLETLNSEQLIKNSQLQGANILSALQSQLAGIEIVDTIRGQGLMIGIELKQVCTELLKVCLDNGLLISIQANNVIRLLPPLIINDAEAELLVSKLVDIIKTFALSQTETQQSHTG